MTNPTSEGGAETHPFVLPSVSRIVRFVAKLERRMALPSDARDALLSLPVSMLQVMSNEIFIEEDSESRRCFFILSGFVSRHKRVDGVRRIVSLGVPGDAVNMQSLWFERQDQGAIAHGRTTLIAVEHDDLIRLFRTHPDVMRVLWHDTLVDAAIMRERALTIGHKRAQFRLAHLILELAVRLEASRLTPSDAFELPLTQSELASVLGLSLVHLNKSMKVLRAQSYIETEGRKIILLNRPALQHAAGFDPAYLHITTRPDFALHAFAEDAADIDRVGRRSAMGHSSSAT